MTNLTSKQILAAIVAVVGIILIAIFRFGFGAQQPILDNAQSQTEVSEQASNPDEVAVVSTKPANLEGATILPNQPIEITFNSPLENEPELKRDWDPKDTDIKTELSSDKKTVKFTPNKPLVLGQPYTLFIKSDTKFEGKKTLDKDLIYHFKTISYTGV
jgi:hypothetical protein